jgi:outer membrane protein OmpA-like peptidoglycan-associated protein
MKRPVIVFAILAYAAFGPMPAAAQDLTESEIAERFQRQATRGLVIAPQTGGAAQNADTAPSTVVYTELPADERVNINIPFDFDSAALREDQKPRLAAFCNVMRDAGDQTFLIVGHTDASGSAAYNERLSLLRAEEVKRYLVSDCGIAQSRLETQGAGMRHPLDADDPRAPANRRVEFQLIS